MDITQISIIFSIISCILTMILLPFTLYALILVKSLEKQTHTVQFMPIDESITNKIDDSSSEIDKINKEHKEDVEEDYYQII